MIAPLNVEHECVRRAREGRGKSKYVTRFAYLLRGLENLESFHAGLGVRQTGACFLFIFIY